MNLIQKIKPFSLFVLILSISIGFSSFTNDRYSLTTGTPFEHIPELGETPQRGFLGGLFRRSAESPFGRSGAVFPPPNMVYIEGGNFRMGGRQEDVMRSPDRPLTSVTVRSFYMDQFEITNRDYLEYLIWMQKVYGDTYPQLYRDALPDTLAWEKSNEYNEPYVHNYLRQPGFRNYPVVGVTWVQAQRYAEWRTDRLNEEILIAMGVLERNENPNPGNVFITETFLEGITEGMLIRDLSQPISALRGRMYPRLRLPTEAEWEYAALGLIGNTINENIQEHRIYPWDGGQGRLRMPERERTAGRFLANFQRAQGNYGGLAGDPNPGGSGSPMPVGSFPPNDNGIYDIAGNVNEWVADVYRPMSFHDVGDINPFRGNIIQVIERDADGNAVLDSLRRLVRRPISDEEIGNRRNFRQADNRSYRDGDARSGIQPINLDDENPETQRRMYQFGESTLISDESRVYKGGGWADRAFWLSPGERRFLDQHQAAYDIGFRLVMDTPPQPPDNRGNRRRR